MKSKIVLEKGLESAEKTIVICNDYITCCRVTVNERQLFGSHYHKNSYEVYDLEKGAAKLYIEHENETIEEKTLEITESAKEVSKNYVLQSGQKHSLYAEAGSVITIYRFNTVLGEPVQTDIIDSFELQATMKQLLNL